MKVKIKRFESLDAFRGICALCVVVYHMSFSSSFAGSPFFRGSFIFVEFFFVLSGFVLAHSFALKKNIDFKGFMKNRLFRLYPLHFFMFIVLLLIEVAKLGFSGFFGVSFGSESFSGSTHIKEVIPNLLLVQSWSSYFTASSFNAPSWSISIELYMYAILFVTTYLFKPARYCAWLLISVSAFYALYVGIELLPSTATRGLSCFFGGACTYLIYSKVNKFKPSYALATIVEVVVIYCVIFIVETDIDKKSILAPALFFTAVLCFSFEGGAVSKAFNVKCMQYLGKLSYSIYMTHFAILFILLAIAIAIEKTTGAKVAPIIGGVRVLNFGGEIINNAVAIFTLFFVVFISGFTYKYIEIKGKEWLSTKAS